MPIENIKKLMTFSQILNILYVEDNEDARESTLLVLENFFDNITVAVNGDDGYDKYIDYHNSTNKFFDLVVTDITMPKMDGIEMCKLIFEHNKQ